MRRLSRAPLHSVRQVPSYIFTMENRKLESKFLHPVLSSTWLLSIFKYEISELSILQDFVDTTHIQHVRLVFPAALTAGS